MIRKFVNADMYKMFSEKEKEKYEQDGFPRRENLLQIDLDKCVGVAINEIYLLVAIPQSLDS